jgi:hypothetical protein
VFDVGNLKFRARGSYYLVSDRYAMLFICHYFSSSPLICSRRYFALRVCFDHSDRKKGHPDTLQPKKKLIEEDRQQEKSSPVVRGNTRLVLEGLFPLVAS